MVAQVQDVTAGYWNPAGLAAIDVPLQFGAMHAEWFAGVAKYDYLAVAKRLQTGTIGLTVIRLGIDKIPNTLRLIEPDGTINYDNITEFSAADYAVLVSYARPWRKHTRWSYGASSKIIRRSIGPFGGAWGFGFDVGVRYTQNNFSFGVVARDVTTTFNAWQFHLTEEEKNVFAQTGNEIPKNSIEITRPSLHLGAGYTRDLSERWQVQGEVDLALTTDGRRNVLISARPVSIAPRIGLAAGYRQIAFLRMGIGQFQRIKDDLEPDRTHLIVQPNLGIGLKFRRIRLDYAFNNLNKAAHPFYAHIFSLTLDFRPKDEEK